MKIQKGILLEAKGSDVVNGKFVIPNSVTEIGNGAFANCYKLESIVISNSILQIGYGAFFNCKKLESINVSKDNKYYSSEYGVLFNKDKTALIKYPECKKDKKYIIPDSVTEIDDMVFYNCIELTSIIISNYYLQFCN